MENLGEYQKVFFLIVVTVFLVVISFLGLVNSVNILKIWWLFPIAFAISLIANVAGISSAALMVPILILILPFVLENITGIQAVRLGIINESFGLASSGLSFYAFNLVDKKIAKRGILLAVPYVILGALLSSYIPESVLYMVVAALLVLSVTLLWYGQRILFERRLQIKHGEINLLSHNENATTIKAKDGKYYKYCREGTDSWKRKIGFSIGGLFQGSAGFGVGELGIISMVLSRIPIKVAIGTVHVVIAVAAIAGSVFHICLSFHEASNIQWNILFVTVPAAVVAGQLAPHVSARLSVKSLEIFISVLFLVIALLLVFLAIA